MRLSRRIIFLFLLSWPSVSYGGDAFPSESYLKGGNRWEGIIDKPVSAKFELVSFRRGPIPKYESGDQLIVSFFAPSALQAEIRARKLTPAGKIYAMLAKRMDWQEGLNVFTPWLVDDVLMPERISNSNLAVAIENNNKVYFPAWVGFEEQPQSDQYYVHFYTPLSIKKLTYSIVDQSGSTVFSDKREEILSKETFLIDLNMSGVGSGFFSMNMSIDWKHDPDAYNPQFSFFHYRVED